MFATTVPTARQSRIEWWRRVIARQQSAQVTLDQFCREMGITVRKFYYWRKRVRDAQSTFAGRQPAVRDSSRPLPAPARGDTASFVPVTIVDRSTTTELEIELVNGCSLRLKGSVDPTLLQAAIAAAAQLDGPGRGGC
jgi:hypothetical protein